MTSIARANAPASLRTVNISAEQVPGVCVFSALVKTANRVVLLRLALRFRSDTDSPNCSAASALAIAATVRSLVDATNFAANAVFGYSSVRHPISRMRAAHCPSACG